MSNDYAGSAAAWPAVIRMPADGENRNATVIDRALEDLADRTAVLFSTATAESSVDSPAVLKALTSAVPPIRYVRGFGLYKYESTYNFNEDVAPWFYLATGLGSGVWVKCDWDALLGGESTRTQFAAALVPQTILGYGAETTPYAVTDASTATSLSPFPVQNTNSDDLTSATLDLVAGSTVHLSAGPFWLEGPTTYAGRLGIKAGSGNMFGEAEIPAGKSGSVTLDVHFYTATDVSVAFSLCARVLGGSDPITIAAPAECQWLRYTILRTPT